jgi:hypothetical protein
VQAVSAGIDESARWRNLPAASSGDCLIERAGAHEGENDPHDSHELIIDPDRGRRNLDRDIGGSEPCMGVMDPAVKCRSLTRIVALIVLLFTAASADAADWVRVETPNFIVFGEIGEKRTREIAEAFERFSEAMARVFPNATASPVPTIVAVFESPRSFAPYRPRHNGKPVAVGGFFVGSENSNIIALTVDDADLAFRTVFHEYTHLVTANAARALPAWADEGLAEFYSTFAVTPDGKRGLLGRAIRSHYALLGRSALLPLEQLLAVDHTSELYNEGQRRSIFYAQSWAMVHMLLAGQPNRSKEFSEYIRLTASGTPSAAAWRHAFGSFDAISEVKRFLRNRLVPGVSYSFEERIGAVTAQVSRPRSSDVDAVLAALLQYSAPDEMEPRLRRAVDMNPPSTLARALLGAAKARADQSTEATRWLFEAAADRSDWLVQYHVALGLTRIVQKSGEQRDEKLVAAANAAIEAVLAARPQLAHALALKAYLQKARAGAATAARARALAPGREDYIYLEASLRAEAGEFAAARKLLVRLLGPAVPQNIRESALRLTQQIYEAETRIR